MTLKFCGAITEFGSINALLSFDSVNNAFLGLHLKIQAAAIVANIVPAAIPAVIASDFFSEGLEEQY